MRQGLRGLLLVCLLGWALPAFGAQEAASSPESRFRIAVGAFFPTYDTLTRLDSPSLGRGTVIDVETDLGVDDRTTDFRLDAEAKFGRRHRARL